MASVYDIQIDLLQLYLALQNDPDVVEFRLSRLRKKMERYGRDFRQVLDEDPVGAYHRKLKGDLAEARWPRLPRGWRLPFGGALARKARHVRAIRKEYGAGQMRIERWLEAFEAVADESRRQSVVFYREPDGERALRAYHTGEVRLEAAA